MTGAQKLLDEFEARFNIQPMQVTDDGTRRYHLDAKDAEVDAFDSLLDKVDPGLEQPPDELEGQIADGLEHRRRCSGTGAAFVETALAILSSTNG